MSTNIDHEAIENSTPEIKAFYDNKKLFRRNIFWYIFGTSAAALGFNTAQGLMPMHMAKIGMDSEQISMAMSIRGVVYTFMVLYLAHLTDHLQCKWGRRLPFLAVSLPFLLIGIYFFPYTKTPMGCLMLFSVFSFFVAVKYDTFTLLTYDLPKFKHWGKVAGIGGFFGSVGILLGQRYLMPMIDTRGEHYVYSLAAGYLLIATVLTMIFVKEPPIRTAEPTQWNPLPVVLSTLRIGLRQRRNIWLFLGFSLATSTSLTFNYLAVQGQVNLHMSQGAVGKHLLQWGTLASMAMAPLLGIAIDKLGAVKVIFIGYVLCFVAAFFGFHPHTVRQLMIASVLITVGFGFMYTSGLVFVAAGIERKYMAIICGCNGAATYLISTPLNVIAGVLIKRVFGGNYGAVFLIGIVLASVGVPMLFWLDRKRKTDPLVTSQVDDMCSLNSTNALDVAAS